LSVKGSTSLRRFCWLQVGFNCGHCPVASCSAADNGFPAGLLEPDFAIWRGTANPRSASWCGLGHTLPVRSGSSLSHDQGQLEAGCGRSTSVTRLFQGPKTARLGLQVTCQLPEPVVRQRTLGPVQRLVALVANELGLTTHKSRPDRLALYRASVLSAFLTSLAGRPQTGSRVRR
jgi:hypothetical protein